MIEKVQKDILSDFLKKLKTIYAVKSEIKSMADNGLLNAVKGMYYGSEAVAVGICAALKESDRIASSFDGIGTLIARGCSVNNILAEMLGKSGGYNNGVRGFFNITVPEKGIYSANSFSDTQVAMGTGFALASKIRGNDEVSAAFYNSCNSNEGIIHESMNIAAAFNLPVLFVCITSIDKKNPDTVLPIVNGIFSGRSIGYEIEGHTVDGMDVISVYLLAEKLVHEIRKSMRPVVMECIVESIYERFGSVENNKTSKDSEVLKKSIISKTMGNLENEMIKNKIITAAQAKDFDENSKKIVKEAAEFAKNSPAPKKDLLNNIMYAEKNIGMQKAGL